MTTSNLTPAQNLHNETVAALRTAAAKGGFALSFVNQTGPGNYTMRMAKADATVEVELKTTETRAIANASLHTPCDLPTYKGNAREVVTLREALRVLRTGQVAA